MRFYTTLIAALPTYFWLLVGLGGYLLMPTSLLAQTPDSLSTSPSTSLSSSSSAAGEDTILHLARRVEISAEVERQADYTFYQVFPLAEKGLVFSMERVFLGRKEFAFVGYDKELEALWQQTYSLETTETRIRHYFVEGYYLYFLLYKKNYEYEILRIDARNGDLYQIPYRKLMKFEVQYFRVLKNIALLGGEAEGKAAVIYWNMLTKEQTLLPSLSKKQTYVAGLEVDTENEQILVILNGKYSQNKEIFFNTYTLDGKLAYQTSIFHNDEYQLMTFRPYFIAPRRLLETETADSVQTQEEQLLILGTYSLKQWQQTQGIYSLMLKGGKEESLKFYDFAYFQNYFGYLDAKAREKVLAKIVKRKKEGKFKRYDHDYFIGDLRIHQNRLFLSLQAYTGVYYGSRFSPNPLTAMPYSPYYDYSRYWIRNDRGLLRSNMNRYYDYENFWSNSKKAPSIFRYFQTIVCAFDTQGRLIWDNQFSHKEIEKTEPAIFVDYAVKNDTLSFLQIDEPKWYYKQTHSDQFEEERQERDRRTLEKTFKEGRTSDELIYAWYGDYFLHTGYQIIRAGEEPRRKVFFIHKISIETQTR
ncbi:hypothetical protein [Hugenholtzia roseola]|uniref:hypothetical protein n=1 Tax=Hugenholtzia roseola TaxID=1002 RepID=UPI00040ECB42|nr:hypothetical protein [Hugenholtzia roseola]